MGEFDNSGTDKTLQSLFSKSAEISVLNMANELC